MTTATTDTPPRVVILYGVACDLCGCTLPDAQSEPWRAEQLARACTDPADGKVKCPECRKENQT